MKRLLITALLCMFSGCMPMPDYLERQIQDGDYERAIKRGNNWLKDTKPTEKNALEIRRVKRLIGVARFERSKSLNTYNSYQAFIRWAQLRRPEFDDLSTKAVAHQSRVFYQTQVLTVNTIRAFRMFRKKYPNAPDFSDAIRREATLALEAALAKGGVRPLQKFRARYKHFEGANDAVSRARQAELSIAFNSTMQSRRVLDYKRFRAQYSSWSEFDRFRTKTRLRELSLALAHAKQAKAVSTYRAFRKNYKGWPEAKAAISEVLELEAALEFQKAVKSSLVARLDSFKKDYPHGDWPQKADRAIATLVLTPIAQPLNNKQIPGIYAIQQFLKDAINRAHVHQFAAPNEGRWWKVIKKGKGWWEYRLFRLLFPNSPRAKQAFKRERDGAWNAVQTSGRLQDYDAFLRMYPTDKRALEAERRYFNLKRHQDSGQKWPRANVTHKRQLPNGNWVLYVDVRDCFGERVSGLRKQVFETYFGHEEGKIVNFLGLEEERPIDVTFGIDLSGSMQTERTAVNEAIIDFSETMQYRGRNARFGLVAFSDTIRAAHKYTKNLRKFRKWMNRLPLNAGGSYEDSANAIVTGSKLGARKGAEKVFILVTDEPLQTNHLGVNALGFKNCKKPINFKPPRVSRQCRRSRACLRRLYKSQMRKYKINRKRTKGCYSGRINQGSPVMEKLTNIIQKARIRLFMMVSDLSHHGFFALRDNVDGQIVEVPQDETDPTPYRDALMNIADQLSKQYVIVVRPPRNAPKGTLPSVAVRHMHLWRGVSNVPTGALVGFSGSGGKSTCPELTLVTRKNGLYASKNCGQQFEKIPLPGGNHELAFAANNERRTAMLTTQGRLFHSAFHGAAPVELTPANGHVLSVVYDDAHWLWGITNTATGGHQVVKWQPSQSQPTSVAPIPVKHEGAIPTLLPPRKDSPFCLMGTPQERWCMDKAAGWKKFKSKGLGKNTLINPVQVIRLPGRKHSLLMATPKGAVYRTINEGKSWQPVLQANGTPRALQLVKGTQNAVCAASDREVLCSEDLGRNFFVVGRPFDGKGNGRMAVIENQIYLAQNGQMYQLERIAARDIPSSAVYFKTSSSKPSARMYRFLNLLVQTMKNESGLTLRIEGHADRRGSARANEKLAQKRAAAVANYIRMQGVDSARVEVESFGERRPVRRGNSAADFSRNRRVELVLLRKMPVKGWGGDPCANR